MIRIVALGDSTTNGAGKSGVTQDTVWWDTVTEEVGDSLRAAIEMINAGVDADVTTLALERLDRDVLKHKPDWVIVMLGTNDAGLFRPPDTYADTPRVPIQEFEANMREIIRRLREAGARVVLCTSVPMSGNYWLKGLPAYVENGLNYLVEQYAQVTRRLAAELGLPLAEVYDAFQQHPQRDDLIPDGIHPDPRGQRLIADTLLPVLERAVEARSA